jgi:hypothetical protein
MSTSRTSAVVALVAGALAASSAQAVVVDTFDRIDLTGTPANSIGPATNGGVAEYTYSERGNAPSATIPDGTASLTGSELRLTGRQPIGGTLNTTGTINNDVGGVYINNAEFADFTASVKIRFEQLIEAPINTGATAQIQELANVFTFIARSRPDVNFTAATTADAGMLDISVGPNGDLQVREVRVSGTTATLTNIVATGFAPNPFTGLANNRRRLTPGVLPATYGGLPFDVDQDGFIDGNESFTFTASLTGTSLSTFINGVQVGAYTLTQTTGANGNFLSMHKNRISSAYEAAADILVDDLNLSPIPEPTSTAALGGIAALALTRRRRS